MRELFNVTADSLDRFLTRWYGPADREPAGAVPCSGPRALTDWFATVPRWSAFHPTQNHVQADPRPDRGKRVVWVENQAVWLWAVDPDEDDPPVYDRLNDPFTEWRPTGVRLSTFLLHVAVFETVMDFEHGACAFNVTQSDLARVLAPLRPLPMADWHWPTEGHRLHAGEGLLAFAGPNDGDWWEVWLAATGPEPLSYLADVTGVEWDVKRP
ncbi:hypothetical protein GCM10029964_006410 [Kibdelosporangium lantanae]